MKDKNLREKDGAVIFVDLIEKFTVEFIGTWGWTVDAWVRFLAKGGGPKKNIQFCLNTQSSKHFMCFRTIQDIQEVLSLILHCKTMYFYWMTLPSASAHRECSRNALDH